MNNRPTADDKESLESLITIEDLDGASRLFIEDLWRRYDEGTWIYCTVKQWQWFDKLVERWL